MLDDRTVEAFLDQLASSQPTPGGGSAAAVMGATGAALLSMVGNLTAGKKGHEAVDAQVRSLLVESERLRTRLQGLVAEDVAGFESLMAAYRLPKDDDVAKASRAQAIQRGLKAASDAPLACARACAEVIRLSRQVAAIGNRNVISDAGVAVLAADAGLRSAVLNVEVNAGAIGDRDYVERTRSELDALLAEAAPIVDAVVATVRQRMAGG